MRRDSRLRSVSKENVGVNGLLTGTSCEWEMIQFAEKRTGDAAERLFHGPFRRACGSSPFCSCWGLPFGLAHLLPCDF